MQRVRDKQASGIDSDSATAGALILFTSATGACGPALVLFVFSYILKIGDSIVQSFHGWNMVFAARNEEQNNVDIG